MVTSQNGWPAGERDEVGLTTVIVPGTKTKLPVRAGDVATVLLWVATRWHNEIEPLVEPGNWGYAYRAVRGATSGLSNHASGTAIDLNAPAHPLATEPLATLSKAQVAAAKRIEADTGGVVRWGGSYTGRKDAMHWEINAGPAGVAAFAARISGDNPPSPTGTPTVEDDMFDISRDRLTIEQTKYAVVDLMKPVIDTLLTTLQDEDAQTDRLEFMLGDQQNGVRVQLARIEARQLVQDAAAVAGPDGLSEARVTEIIDETIARHLEALGEQFSKAAAARQAKTETIRRLVSVVADATAKLSADEAARAALKPAV